MWVRDAFARCVCWRPEAIFRAAKNASNYSQLTTCLFAFYLYLLARKMEEHELVVESR
jgi:hypothetical protein